MLSLKDINIKSVYSSEEDDILREFYIPALSVATNYYRITGFFSSDSLAVAAKGLANLIRNEGNMKLITGSLIKREDILVAEEVLENPTPFIKEIESRIDNFEEIENIFIKESVKALAWMLSKNLLEIKIALPKRNFKEEFNAIFHPKIGIIEDFRGNKISFSGSINETGVGWLKNIEEFKVFRNWRDIEKEYFENDYHRFFRLWNNLSDKVEVIPLYQAIKNKLLRFAPKSKEDINLDILDGKFSITYSVAQFNLRDYQQEAIDKWKDNSYKGLIEMATGTGKTYVGIGILREFFKKERRGVVLILSPTNEINKQWKEKIEKYTNCNIIIVGSNNPKWRRDIENLLHDYKRGRKDKLIIISTYDSLNNVIDYLSRLSQLLLIADEVHSFGSKERINILDSEVFDKRFIYRVGLSATPERFYDTIGTNKIKAFFGGIVFRMIIGDAIKKGILCPYNYFTNVVDMTNREFKEYVKLTKKLGRISNKHLEEEEYLTILANKRANIIKSAENKFNVLKDIIKDLQMKNNLKYTFVFCLDSNQMNYVKNILDELKITYSQITGQESLQEREKILSSFIKGNIYVISSMKVLNEGIDIPNVKNAIILSSSSNPREYIQRRGRVLRKIKNEEKIANIFDFIVIPPQIQKKDVLFDLERKIIKKELLRIFEFLRYSRNKSDIFKNHKMIKIIEKYNLDELYNLLRTKD